MSEEPKRRRSLALTPPPTPTPINDWGEAWNQIAKTNAGVTQIAGIVENLSATVGEIHDNVEEARREATRAAILAESLDKRVERAEQHAATSHPCRRTSDIEELSTGVQTAQQVAQHAQLAQEVDKVRLSQVTVAIETLEQRIQRAAERRRNWLIWGLGILVALLGAASGAIWYVAQMAKTLELESNQRQQDQVQIIQQLEKMRPAVNRDSIEPPRGYKANP